MTKKTCNACGRCTCEAVELKFENLRCAGALPENWHEQDEAKTSMCIDENHVVVDGVEYEAVGGETCRWCDFGDKSIGSCAFLYRNFYCTAPNRLDHRSVIWKRVEKKDELPGWCKVGALVWNIDCEIYGKIEKIKGGMVETEKLLASPNRFLPARIRPWTLDEITPLLPLVVAERGDGNTFRTVVLSAADKFVWLGSASSGIEYAELLAEFEQLDGSPCGTLEHPENGEWVK